MRPFVAVTTSLDPGEGGHGKGRVSIYANYLTAIERKELSCILLTPAHSAESIRAIIASCSGLLLSGGEDVEPSRYGEEPLPELGTVNPGRDAMEFHALEAALERELPVFGICRGHELLNVYFGGTLYQDIATQIPGELSHYQTTEWGEHHHTARIVPETRLASILGDETLEINSFHHQAIKDLAPGFRSTAIADDGLIEAVEATERPWVVGVQWHPERYEAKAPHSDPNRRVLRAFRDAVVEFWERGRSCGPPIAT